MKKYKESYLKTWKKDDLIGHILCLQRNLEGAKAEVTHLCRTMEAAMHENPAFREAVGKVLDVWNKSGGKRYTEDEQCMSL